MPHNSGPATFFLKQKTKLYMENVVLLGQLSSLFASQLKANEPTSWTQEATGIFPIQA